MAADSDVETRRINGKYKDILAIVNQYDGETITTKRIASTGERGIASMYSL